MERGQVVTLLLLLSIAAHAGSQDQAKHAKKEAKAEAKRSAKAESKKLKEENARALAEGKALVARQEFDSARERFLRAESLIPGSAVGPLARLAREEVHRVRELTSEASTSFNQPEG